MADSKSSALNISRARKILPEYMDKVGANDPKEVTPDSSMLICNLLSEYCGVQTENPLGEQSMTALIQGLRFLYEECGHRGRWTVDTIRGVASGNLLKDNEELAALRSAHRVRLARLGRTSARPRPLQVGHVLEHASRFWLGSGNFSTYQDILLHSIMVIGLNQG